MCVSVTLCVVIPFIVDVRLLVDVSSGVTQEEGHTRFLHLPFAVLALIFLARKIQPLLLSLVDREVEYCVCVCFLPIHSGLQLTYQPGSHRKKVTQDFPSTFFLRCLP